MADIIILNSQFFGPILTSVHWADAGAVLIELATDSTLSKTVHLDITLPNGGSGGSSPIHTIHWTTGGSNDFDPEITHERIFWSVIKATRIKIELSGPDPEEGLSFQGEFFVQVMSTQNFKVQDGDVQGSFEIVDSKSNPVSGIELAGQSCSVNDTAAFPSQTVSQSYLRDTTNPDLRRTLGWKVDGS